MNKKIVTPFLSYFRLCLIEVQEIEILQKGFKAIDFITGDISVKKNNDIIQKQMNIRQNCSIHNWNHIIG